MIVPSEALWCVYIHYVHVGFWDSDGGMHVKNNNKRRQVKTRQNWTLNEMSFIHTCIHPQVFKTSPSHSSTFLLCEVTQEHCAGGILYTHSERSEDIPENTPGEMEVVYNDLQGQDISTLKLLILMCIAEIKICTPKLCVQASVTSSNQCNQWNQSMCEALTIFGVMSAQ